MRKASVIRGAGLASAAVVVAAIISITVSAQQSAPSGGDTRERTELQQKLSETLGAATQGQLEVVALHETPAEGIVEVELSTGETLFSTRDGDFLFSGELFQTSDQGLINLSAQKRQVKVQEWVADIPEEEMIIYSPEEQGHQTLGSMTVFTDVDCTYCRRLHRDMDDLLARGIEVRYVAYPRGGEQSGAFPKMISVWCSEDRKRSLTQAKNGQDLPSRECDNPVLEHYQLGNRIGISGTPAIVLNDGQVIPGYIGAEQLEALVAQGR